MDAKKHFLNLVTFTTEEYGLPPYISDVESTIDTLLEFMPEDLLEKYCTEHPRANPSVAGFGPINFLMPVSLLVAGHALERLTQTQSKETLEKIRKKFQDIRLVDSQLSDLLAEIECAAIVGATDEIKLDAETGIKSVNGSKDADILHVKSGIFFEVKNFEFGKSQHEKKFSKIAQEVISNPLNQGKVFQIEKGKATEIPGKGNASGVSGQLFTFRKSYAKKIRDTYKKFDDSHKAILILFNVPFNNQAIEAIENWRKSRTAADRIKVVVIIGHIRPAEGYTRETHRYFLEDNPKDMELFIDSLS